jgi:hypothetical protein
MKPCIVRAAVLPFLLMVVAFAAAAPPVVAQAHRFEIGVDATFTSIGEEGAPGVRVLDVPRWLRLGLPLGDHLLLEAGAGWRRVSSERGFSSTLELRPSIAWLWNDPGSIRPYVALVGGVERASDADESAYQANLGAAVGLRVPLRGGALLRLEAGLDHAFETDRMRAANRLRLGVGVSIGIR